MQLFSHSLYSARASSDLITAANLAKWQMEKIKNLNLTKAQLIEQGSSVYPPLEEEPLSVNDSLWRIYTVIMPDTEPLEVRVNVNQEGSDEATVSLVTLVEDMLWTATQ